MKTPRPPCKTRLTYTTSDDGVWIECACGWRLNLAFDTTAEQAYRFEKEHLERRKAEDNAATPPGAAAP